MRYEGEHQNPAGDDYEETLPLRVRRFLVWVLIIGAGVPITIVIVTMILYGLTRLVPVGH